MRNDEKDFEDKVISGMIIGTAVFALLSLVIGAWQQPWYLLLTWVWGVGYVYCIEWIDRNG